MWVQIVTGLANGQICVLYSPSTSINGAKLLLNKGPPRKATIEDMSDALAAPTIITPHALPMFRDGEIARGTLFGPRLFTSGAKLEGIKPIWKGTIEVGSPAQQSCGSSKPTGLLENEPRQAQAVGSGPPSPSVGLCGDKWLGNLTSSRLRTATVAKQAFQPDLPGLHLFARRSR